MLECKLKQIHAGPSEERFEPSGSAYLMPNRKESRFSGVDIRLNCFDQGV